MLDIVLMQPNRLDHYRPPLWAIYVGGYLKHKGLTVKVGDFEQARNIGISCMSTEFDDVKLMIKELRNITSAKIIVGGIHPTLKPDDFKGLADAWIRGDGEMEGVPFSLVLEVDKNVLKKQAEVELYYPARETNQRGTFICLRESALFYWRISCFT